MREGVTLLALAALAASGCARDWRTDMWFQPSLRAEDAPRPEPEGSIALGAPVDAPVDREDADDRIDPLRPTPATLARGRALFQARCAPCHGPEGRGGGPVSKYFPAAPDLAAPTTRKRSDGYLWGTITFGGKAMPAQREGLTVEDRWALVHHVRSLQERGQ